MTTETSLLPFVLLVRVNLTRRLPLVTCFLGTGPLPFSTHLMLVLVLFVFNLCKRERERARLLIHSPDDFLMARAGSG